MNLKSIFESETLLSFLIDGRELNLNWYIFRKVIKEHGKKKISKSAILRSQRRSSK